MNKNSLFNERSFQCSWSMTVLLMHVPITKEKYYLCSNSQRIFVQINFFHWMWPLGLTLLEAPWPSWPLRLLGGHRDRNQMSDSIPSLFPPGNKKPKPNRNNVPISKWRKISSQLRSANTFVRCGRFFWLLLIVAGTKQLFSGTKKG